MQLRKLTHGDPTALLNPDFKFQTIGLSIFADIQSLSDTAADQWSLPLTTIRTSTIDVCRHLFASQIASSRDR